MAINEQLLERIQNLDNLEALKAIATANGGGDENAFYAAVRNAVRAQRPFLNEPGVLNIEDAEVTNVLLPDEHVAVIRKAAARRYLMKKLETLGNNDAFLNALFAANNANVIRQALVDEDNQALLDINLEQAYGWDPDEQNVLDDEALVDIRCAAAIAQFKAKVTTLLARNAAEDQAAISALAGAGADTIKDVLDDADFRARLGITLQAAALLGHLDFEVLEPEVKRCQTKCAETAAAYIETTAIANDNAAHFFTIAQATTSQALVDALDEIGFDIPQGAIAFDSDQVRRLQAQAARKYVEHIIPQVEGEPGAAADYDNRNVLIAIAACNNLAALKIALKHGGGAADLLGLEVGADADHANNAMVDALNEADFNAIRKQAAARLFSLGIDNGVADAAAPAALQQTIDRLERLARASDNNRASQQLYMAALTLATADGQPVADHYAFPNMGDRMVAHGLTEAVQNQAGWYYLNHLVNTKAAGAITINDKDALTELAKAADATAFIAQLPRLGIKIDEQQIRDGFAGLKQAAFTKLIDRALLADNTSTQELRALVELEGDEFRDGLSRIIFGDGVAGVITAINYPDAALEQAKERIIPNLMNAIYTEPVNSDDPDAPAATIYSERYLNRMQALASAADANAFRALLNDAPYNLEVTPAILSDQNITQLQRKAAHRVLRGKIVAAVTQPSQSATTWSGKLDIIVYIAIDEAGDHRGLLNADGGVPRAYLGLTADNYNNVFNHLYQGGAELTALRQDAGVAALTCQINQRVANHLTEISQAVADGEDAREEAERQLADHLVALKAGFASANFPGENLDGALQAIGLEGDGNAKNLRNQLTHENMAARKGEIVKQINAALFRLKFVDHALHFDATDTRLDGMFQHFQRLSLEQQNEMLRKIEAPGADANIASLVNARTYVDFNLAMEKLGFSGDDSFRAASRDFETTQQQLKWCDKIQNYHVARQLRGLITSGVDLQLDRQKIDNLNQLMNGNSDEIFRVNLGEANNAENKAAKYHTFINNVLQHLQIDHADPRAGQVIRALGLDPVAALPAYLDEDKRLRTMVYRAHRRQARIRQVLDNPSRQIKGKAFLHDMLTRDIAAANNGLSPRKYAAVALLFSRHDTYESFQAALEDGFSVNMPQGYLAADNPQDDIDIGINNNDLPTWLQHGDDNFISEAEFNAIKEQQKRYDYVRSKVNPAQPSVLGRRPYTKPSRDVRTLKNEKMPQNYFADDKARKVYEDMEAFADVPPGERIVLLRPDKKGREEGTKLVQRIDKLLNASRNIMQQQQKRIEALELIYSQADELRPGEGAVTLRTECTEEITGIRGQLETLQQAESRLQIELQYAREMASSSIDHTVFINEYTEAGEISDASELEAIIARTRGQTRTETQQQAADRVAVIGTAAADGINTHSNLRVSFARDVARGQCQQVDVWVGDETPATAPGAAATAAPPTRRVYAQAIKVDAATRANQPKRAQMYLSGFPARATGGSQAQQRAANEMRARYALITMSKYIIERPLRKTKGGKLRRDFQSSVPNKQHRISIKAKDPQEAQLLWHACVWLGQNTPGVKWGPEAIDTSQSAFKPVEGDHYDRGWFNKLSFPEGAPMNNFQTLFARINGDIGITHATAQGLAARSTSQMGKSADKKEVRAEYQRRAEIFKGAKKHVEKAKGGDDLVKSPSPSTGPGAGG